METKLREILMKTENAEQFAAELVRFLKACPTSTPIEFEKVFSGQHRPKTKSLLIKTVVQIQHHRVLMPDRDVSFNSDASRFQILDNTMMEQVIKMREKIPA